MNSKIIAFAIEAHEKVNHRYDGKPYSVHLSMVVDYACKYKEVVPENVIDDVIAACWLHDTIEDCRLTYNDIKKVAGETVAKVVFAVTNEKGKTREERANEKYYAGIRNTPLATYVKLCDRLANVVYSYQNESQMYEVYRKENKHFLNSLFPEKHSTFFFKEMISELKSLLGNPK